MRTKAMVLLTAAVAACGADFDGDDPTGKLLEEAAEEPTGGTGPGSTGGATGGVATTGGATSTGGTTGGVGGTGNQCPNGSPITVTLRAGVNLPVNGAQDTWIDEQNSNTVNVGSPSCNVTGASPLTGKDRYCLLHWDIYQVIPPGKVVLDAWLQLTVFDASQNTYPVQFLLRSWDPATATWVKASSQTLWSVPGAKGSQERDPSYFGTVPAGAPIGSVTVPATGVSIQKVQGWVNDPSTNNGLIIAHETNTDNLRIRSSASPTASEHPGLGIKYCP